MEVHVKLNVRTLLALGLLAAACNPSTPCGLRVCDIRDPVCQQDTARAAACLRGNQDVTVPIKMISRAQFQAESLAEARAATPAEVESFGMWQRALSGFGLGDPGLTLTELLTEQAGWVAAFYQPSDKTVTVVDDGAPMNSPQAVTLLVHESVHALQDQSVGLEAFRDRVGANDLDRLLASKAVTEGEATLLEDLAALGLFGTSAAEANWAEVFGRWKAWARQLAAESRMPVYMAWGHFPYPFGGAYVNAVHRRGGLDGVTALYQQPPVNTAQVLAGLGADSGGGPWSDDLGAVAVPMFPAPYVHVDGDRLGGWVLDVFLDRFALRFGSLQTTATPGPISLLGLGRDLRADRFSIFRNTITGAIAACWRLRFASAVTALALAQGLKRGGWNTAAIDRDLVVLGGTTGVEHPVVATELTFGPVPTPPMMPMPMGMQPGPRGAHICPRRLP